MHRIPTIVRASARAARRPVLGVALALAATSSLLLTACSGPSQPPQMARCGVIGDASGSATELLARARPTIEQFVYDKRCGTVQLVAITANSVGETCTAPSLDLTGGITADPSNTAAWEKEYRDEQVPRVSAATAKLAQCVAQRGTAAGTDIFGALTELNRLAGLDRTTDPVPVLLVSDLVQSMKIDLATVPLATPDDRARVRSQVEASGLVPPMKGWLVDVAGGAFGTTALGPERSAQLQLFFKELVEDKGGSWEMSSV